MANMIDVEIARAALAGLPERTSYDESPSPEEVYLPPSHLKAMDPNNMLVIGMRGAGKTFLVGGASTACGAQTHRSNNGTVGGEREYRGPDGVRNSTCVGPVPRQRCAESSDAHQRRTGGLSGERFRLGSLRRLAIQSDTKRRGKRVSLMSTVIRRRQLGCFRKPTPNLTRAVLFFSFFSML